MTAQKRTTTSSMSSSQGQRASGQRDNGEGPSSQYLTSYTGNQHIGVGDNSIITRDFATTPRVVRDNMRASGLSAQASAFAPSIGAPRAGYSSTSGPAGQHGAMGYHASYAQPQSSRAVAVRPPPGMEPNNPPAHEPFEHPFTDEIEGGGVSRYIGINIDAVRLMREGQSLDDVYAVIDVSAFNNAVVHPGTTRPFVVVNGGNTLVFAFDALSDAEQAMDDPVINALGVRRYLEVHEYFRLVGTQDRREVVNRYEGQILLTISPTSAQWDNHMNWSALLHWFDILLGSSDLRAVRVFSRTGTTTTFRIELDRLMTATSILTIGTNNRRYNNNGCEYVVSIAQYYPEAYDPIERRQRALEAPHAPNLPIRQNHAHNVNVVDEEKILLGQDVRTTVMVRNIPNQMTTYELEAILKSYVPGKYDFIYLRIDFHAMSNVGYAFVNLESPLDIYHLNACLKRNGWGAVETKKSPALSYATVQGREALIEKFRNSSVMEEGLDCRPRLFYTQTEAQKHAGDSWKKLSGKAQSFPGANNTSKLERSRQNAETQGLWASNHRQKPGQPAHNLDPGNPRAPTGVPHLARGQMLGPRNPPAAFASRPYNQPGLGAAMNAFNGQFGGPYGQPSHMATWPVMNSYAASYHGNNGLALDAFGGSFNQPAQYPYYPVGGQIGNGRFGAAQYNHNQFGSRTFDHVTQSHPGNGHVGYHHAVHNNGHVGYQHPVNNNGLVGYQHPVNNNVQYGGVPGGRPISNMQPMRPVAPTATGPNRNDSALAGRPFSYHPAGDRNTYGIGAAREQPRNTNPYGIGAGESSGTARLGNGRPTFRTERSADLEALAKQSENAHRAAERAARQQMRQDAMQQTQSYPATFRPSGGLSSTPAFGNAGASPQTPRNNNNRVNNVFATPAGQIQHGTPVCPPRPEHPRRQGVGIGPSIGSPQSESGRTAQRRNDSGLQSPGAYQFGGRLRGPSNTDRGGPLNRFGGNLGQGDEGRSNDNTDRYRFG